VENAEATPPVAGESVTTTRGASGPDWSNLQADYERLGSFKAVANLYGVAPETVSRAARRLGIVSLRRWRMTHLDPAELRKLYEAGASVPDLAEQFRSSQSSIYMRLWMAGTQMRRTGHDGWTWGPEQYEKRAAATARGAFQGIQRERFRRLGRQTPKMNSPQEQFFQQALIRARLSFETQSRELGRYYPDIKLHQQPVLIEIDSWGHLMPGSAEFDKKRDAELAEAGYTVVRFSNEQIEDNVDSCVQWLIDRFGLEAEEDPVAIIRNRRGHQPASGIKPDDDIV
jgi:very-short-patch-repair endonuclease